MSPDSSRSLARIHNQAAASGSNTHLHDDQSNSSSDTEPTNQNSLVHTRAGHTHPRESSPSSTYDSLDLSRHRKSRRRRNSDPSSNRPNQVSKYRRSQRNASRSPSNSSEESSSEVEVLPDRFDADGRPLDRYGNAYQPRQSSGSGSRWRGSVGWLHGDSKRGLRGGARTFGSGGELSRMDYDDRRISRNERDRDEHEKGGGGQEMVEKWAKDFGDVFEGKKTWKDLLMGFVAEAGSLGGASGSRESLDDRDLDDRDRDRDRRRRRRRDTDRY